MKASFNYSQNYSGKLYNDILPLLNCSHPSATHSNKISPSLDPIKKCIPEIPLLLTQRRGLGSVAHFIAWNVLKWEGEHLLLSGTAPCAEGMTISESRMDTSNLFYLINWQFIFLATLWFSVSDVKDNANNSLLILRKLRKTFFWEINGPISNKLLISKVWTNGKLFRILEALFHNSWRKHILPIKSHLKYFFQLNIVPTPSKQSISFISWLNQLIYKYNLYQKDQELTRPLKLGLLDPKQILGRNYILQNRKGEELTDYLWLCNSTTALCFEGKGHVPLICLPQ